MKAKITNNRERYVTRAKKATHGAGLSYQEKLAASGVRTPIIANEFEERMEGRFVVRRKKCVACK
uniref:Uncharacterized protein n=1 Tax=Citrifermentans bremense TaxID=60035 RepID=A0A6S6LYN9_9BACT